MRILVLSKLSIPALNRTLPQWDYACECGHDVLVTDVIDEAKSFSPDVIIAMGVGVLYQTEWAFKRWPNVKRLAYQWDRYSWAVKRPRPGEYDYNLWGELLKQCNEIWVPSECTGHQAAEWWGLTNWHVIRSCVPTWECSDVSDHGYALCTLREVPDDYWGLFERCCEELGIPYKMTVRDIPRAEYERDVAHCRFIVSHLREMSTGGLSLLEAYYHGKPVLMGNSPYHGGRDYFGERATYFQHDDAEDFKAKLFHMIQKPPKLDRAECRRWVSENFHDSVMVNQMLDRISKL
jgi:hypothetical protein